MARGLISSDASVIEVDDHQARFVIPSKGSGQTLTANLGISVSAIVLKRPLLLLLLSL